MSCRSSTQSAAPAEKIFFPLLNGQVPIFLGTPNIAEHAPAGSYIDVADFPSVAALVAHLRYLEANSEAYARYHAWRHASFETYGVYFRRELLRWIGLAHHFGGPQEAAVFRCAMCYSMTEWANATGFTTGGATVVPRQITDFVGACTAPWTNTSQEFPKLPGTTSAHVTAAEYYGARGVTPPALIAEAAAAAKRAAAGTSR